MNSTLKLLSSIIVDEDREMTLEQISEGYRESLNPSLLALAFEKVHRLIINISYRYYGLTEDDIISFGLEKLDYCLINYKTEQALFTTYFTTVLNSKFREETQALNTQKRKAIFYSDSYEVMIENGYDLIAATCEEIGIKDTLISYNLTQRELTYCELIMKNYSNAEISEILEVSIMTLSNMRKKLRQKLSPLALGF